MILFLCVLYRSTHIQKVRFPNIHRISTPKSHMVVKQAPCSGTTGAVKQGSREETSDPCGPAIVLCV